jgi:hypothetical protein
MRGRYSLVGAAALLLAVAPPFSPVYAAEMAPSGGMHGAEMSGMQTKEAAHAWYPVTGTITKVERTKGFVTLKATPATLHLRFAPAAVRNLKDGEKITAQMAFSPMSAEKTTRAYDAPAAAEKSMPLPNNEAMGLYTVVGTVRNVDHSKGTFGFQSGSEKLTLFFPPSAIRDLKDGERIALHLAFNKGEKPS